MNQYKKQENEKISLQSSSKLDKQTLGYNFINLLNVNIKNYDSYLVNKDKDWNEQTFKLDDNDRKNHH